MSALTHEFDEWRHNFVPDTASPIPWTDVLKATGQADRIATFEAKLVEQLLLDSIFATPVEGEPDADQ